MICKEYLLDANIIIKVWNKYPNLLDAIETADYIDFKISQDIAGELSVKEYVRFNSDFVLSAKFIKLLGHIITNTGGSYSETPIESDFIKYEQNKHVYFNNGDKISINDYSLISICEKNESYTLVTEDKRMMRNAKIILASSRVLNLEQFLDELRQLDVLE